MKYIGIVAVALLSALAASKAHAWDQQEIFVPQSGIEGKTEIRLEFGIFCRNQEAAETLIRATAEASKPKFAHGSMSALHSPVTAESQELACGLDQLVVAGVFPIGKLRTPTVIPVRVMESDGPDVRYLVMK